MRTTDVLVIGGGIAGTVAAIEAALNGARVSIACAGHMFGGSSFYPGTWGLGLIGPIDEADSEDLVATIERVGCGAADHDLVETLVHGIVPGMEWLEDELGMKLVRPTSSENAQQREFIPCFDHKNRLWRGITRCSFVTSARRKLDELAIEIHERLELMQLVQTDPDGCIEGALLYDRGKRRFSFIQARSIILATGGTGGLFERSLTSRDVLSSTHGIALNIGCTLINIEFMQMMPGLVSPKQGLVFNEKTFRYVCARDENEMLPTDSNSLRELFATRSCHGPFTSRLGDELVDLAIDAAGPAGLAIRYDFPKHDIPEFVQTFSSWLEEEHGISPHDEMRIAMYAHASNGGIQIDVNAWTGLDGLYACGEATGGMHGADRLGGLSSANGLVFGRIAGKSAATHARETFCKTCGHTEVDFTRIEREEERFARDLLFRQQNITPITAEPAETMTSELRRAMSTHCMVQRTQTGLETALKTLDGLQERINRRKIEGDNSLFPDEMLANGVRLTSQITLARQMALAMLERTESLGSHYRADMG